MKPALRLGISQHLSLTPQLKQAIRLLQLSAVELEQEIQEALETNPVLEREGEIEPAVQPETSPSTDSVETSVENAADAGVDGPDAPELAPDPSETIDTIAAAPDENWSDAAFDDWRPSGSGSGVDAEGDSLEARTAAPETLQEHLHWQLNLTPFSPRDRAIADAIIESIDEDGYLRDPLEAIQAALRPDVEAAFEDIEAVRHRVQHFDPVGVASRNLVECLGVQLNLMDADTPGLDLARTLVAEHLESIAKLDREKLAKKLSVDTDAIDEAIELVRSLDPRPGNGYGNVSTEYVVPDAYAYKAEGRWRVRINPSCQPSLAVNRHYERLAAESREEAAGYLRGRLQEARWLIKSLKARGETLMKVAACIVRQQSAFLDYGPEAMRPLTLREVADEIGVHESTVSRITTRKYLHTPRGTFEFKHFFSVGLATAEGGETSATAIRAMIRKLVDEEDPRKPLSDSAIAGDLNQRGIAVARRTVAKYREAMNIPASSERCRLA